MKIWYERLNEIPSEKNTVMEFLEERNFTWKILSQPCYQKVGDEYKIIPNHQISVRDDDFQPIAVTKNRYKLLSNDKCFEIANEFKRIYPFSKFVSCGDIMNNKESYLSMFLNEELICDDEFGVWLTISNGFDGRNAVNATVTLVRNKDNSVFQFFEKNIPRVWTLGRMDMNRYFDRVCEGIDGYVAYAKDLCCKMNEIKISLNEVMNKLFDDINWKNNKRFNRNLAMIKECVREIYLDNKGDTEYDLFFALSNYYCNGKRIRCDKLEDDKRFQLAMIKYFYDLYKYHVKMFDTLN